MEKNYHYIVLPVLSGLLLILGQSFSSLSFLMWLGFLPLLFLSYKVPFKDFRRAFLPGFITGSIYFSIFLSWLWSLYPLSNLGIQSSLLSFLIIDLIWLITTLAMALFWGLWSMGIIFIKHRSATRISLLLATPALFGLIEYLRSYALGLVWLGHESVIGPHFSLGNIAYAFSKNSLLLRLSSYIGIYGISFIIILINCAVYLIFNSNRYSKKQKYTLTIIVIAILGSSTFIRLGDTTTHGKTLHYALIQTNQPTQLNYSSSQLLNNFKDELGALNKLSSERDPADIIVMPEASGFFQDFSSFFSVGQTQSYFNQLFPTPRLLIAAGKSLSQETMRSRTFFLNTKQDIIGYYDKKILTPIGEFLPFLIKIPDFIQARGFEPATADRQTIVFQDTRINGFICSELLSPSFIRSVARDSDVLIGQMSTAVFRGNSYLTQQNLAQARFRAAENHIPMLVSSNIGRSYAINALGNVLATTKSQDAQILTGSLDINSERSWYNELGDIPIVISFILILTVFSPYSLRRSRA